MIVGFFTLLAHHAGTVSYAQTRPTPTIYGMPPQEVLNAAAPTFGSLGPCQGCTSPSNPPAGSAQPTSGTRSPSPSLAPCITDSSFREDNAKNENKNKSKHKKHNGSISSGIDKILKLLIELLRLILGEGKGGTLQSSDAPKGKTERQASPTQRQAPKEPTNQPNQRSATPTPCAPQGNNPSGGTQRSGSQPTTQPSKAQPSKAQPSAGQPQSGGAPAPSAAAQPPPGGSADACAPQPGKQLQDQDMTDSQLPWKKNGPGKVQINFTTNGVPPEWVEDMKKGVAAWNKSQCIETKLVPTCQPNTNCVTVKVNDGGGADGNFNAQESGGFTTGGSIDLKSTLKGGEKTNVTIHEMGHAVGLRHRKTQRVLMNGDTYPDVFDPDDIDFQNLQVLYGNQK